MRHLFLLLLSTLFVLLFLVITSTGLWSQQWEPVGPPGGVVYTMAIDSTTGTIIASSGFRTYRLLENDSLWHPSTLEFSSVQDGIQRFTSTRDGIFAVAGCCRILFSTDQGETWETRSELPTSGLRTSLVTLRDTLYAHVKPGNILFSSTDNGYNWNRFDSTPFTSFALFTNGRNLYMTSSIGLHRKEANGEWKTITPETAAGRYVCFAGDTIVFMSSSFNLYRTLDGGKVWKTLPNPEVIISLTIHDGMIWGGTFDKLFSIPVTGGTWTQRNGEYRHAIQPYDLVVHNDDILLGGGGGIYRWNAFTEEITPFYNGWNAQHVHGVLSFDDSLIASTPYGLYVAGNDGRHWQRRGGPRDLGAGNPTEINGTLYTILMGFDSCYVSTDRGATWNAYDIDGVANTPPVALLATGNNVYANQGRTIYKSEDRGENWRRIDIPDNTVMLGALAGSGDTIFAASVNGGTVIYRSLDAGATWKEIPFDNTGAQSFVLRYTDGTLYMGTREHGLYRSTNQGDAWEDIGTNFSRAYSGEDSVTVVGLLDVYGDTLFAHVQVGDVTKEFVIRTFASVDRGNTWEPLLPPGEANILCIIPHGEQLLAGTDRSGIVATRFTLSLDPADPDRVKRTSAIGYRIDRSLVEWRLDHPSIITLTLHSIDGKKITTLFEGRSEAGTHQLPLPELSLPSGNYICTLRTAEGEVVSTTVPIR